MPVETHTIKLTITFSPFDSTTEHEIFSASARVGLDELCDPGLSAASLLTRVPSADELAVMISDKMDDLGLSCNPE